MKKITVVSVKVGEKPNVVTVDADLESYHKLVGGWIETVRVAEDILMIVNEEGMITDLPINFVTFAGLEPVHQIHGNVFFVGVAGSDFVSLDKEQINRVREMFRFDRNACVVRM